MLGVYAGEAGSSGVLAEALKRIRRSKTPVPKALALAEIAAVMARSGDKRRARQVLKEADRAAEAANAALRLRIAENETNRFRIMVRCAEAHALVGSTVAERLFRAAEQEVPNLRGWDRGVSLAEALAGTGRYDEARRLASLKGLRDYERADILRTVVAQLIRHDRLEEASRDAEAIASGKLRADAYSTIALGFVSRGHEERAAEYLARAIETRQLAMAASHTVSARARLAEALLPGSADMRMRCSIQRSKALECYRKSSTTRTPFSRWSLAAAAPAA